MLRSSRLVTDVRRIKYIEVLLYDTLNTPSIEVDETYHDAVSRCAVFLFYKLL